MALQWRTGSLATVQSVSGQHVPRPCAVSCVRSAAVIRHITSHSFHLSSSGSPAVPLGVSWGWCQGSHPHAHLISGSQAPEPFPFLIAPLGLSRVPAELCPLDDGAACLHPLTAGPPSPALHLRARASHWGSAPDGVIGTLLLYDVSSGREPCFSIPLQPGDFCC